MKLSNLAETLGLKVINRGNDFDAEVTGGYTSDLLSDVMGNIDEGMVWITLQVHRNTIAVASLKEVAGVVIIGGASLDEETLEQARKEGVTILSTDMPAFEASGRIYRQLIIDN
jgi:predicted transcriptional regulator